MREGKRERQGEWEEEGERERERGRRGRRGRDQICKYMGGGILTQSTAESNWRIPEVDL